MPAPDYATEIAQLRAGMASGEARIESDGESIYYRGVGEILKALTYFEGLAATAVSPAPRTASTVAVFDPR